MNYIAMTQPDHLLPKQQINLRRTQGFGRALLLRPPDVDDIVAESLAELVHSPEDISLFVLLGS